MFKTTLTTGLQIVATSVLTVLMFSACGAKDGNRQAATPAPVTAAAPVATTARTTETKDRTCRTLSERYNPGTAKFVSSTQTYAVERHFQRVIRKNCQGQVTSDKIETVQPPRVQFRLTLPKQRDFKSVFLFNETSCDHIFSAAPSEPSLAGQILNTVVPFSLLSPLSGDGRSYVDVQGDLATALLTFEMAKGPNVLYAEYHYDCMPKEIKGNVRVVRGGDDKQSCDASVDKQIVMYPIVTTYEEKTLPGAQIVEPTTRDCEQEAQKKK